MKTKFILSALFLSLIFTSCGSKSAWTDQDKENLKKNAMEMVKTDPAFTTDEQRTKFSECLLEKTMSACPTPLDQFKMSTADATKMTNDCIAESIK